MSCKRWCDANPSFDGEFASSLNTGRLIAFARGSAGLSQFRLAERLGAAQSWISRLESGERLPTLKTLARIAIETKLVLTIGFEGKGDREDARFDGGAYELRRSDLQVARRLEWRAGELRRRHGAE